MPERAFLKRRNMSLEEIKRIQQKWDEESEKQNQYAHETHQRLLERKQKAEKLHKELIEEQISVIDPLAVLNEINEEVLKGKGEVIEQDFEYVKNFNLSWERWSTGGSAGSYGGRCISITFYHFMHGSRDTLNEVNQLFYDSFNGSIFPGFVIIGGVEAGPVKEYGRTPEVKGIYLFNTESPKNTTVFKITGPIEKIKPSFEEIKPLFEHALAKAFENSAWSKDYDQSGQS